MGKWNSQAYSHQLTELANIFDTTVEYLVSGTDRGSMVRSAILFRGLDSNNSVVSGQLNHWLNFLDGWTELLAKSGQKLKFRSTPAKSLDRGADFSDIRSAAKVAQDVRDFYGLGLYALPDLYTFLDEQEVIVCQAKLGSIGTGKQGISGAFYNHPKLGYCILINAETSRGRQTFTMAHEFAHALFHYGDCSCIVSQYGDSSSREQFADSFASHFLAPAKGLKAIVEKNFNPLDERAALVLSHYYGVSYAFMLNRLAFQGLIEQQQKLQWQKLSPRALAANVGLDQNLFKTRTNIELGLARYPVSILRKVKTLIDDRSVGIQETSKLFGLNSDMLTNGLVHVTAEADADEEIEAAEFSQTYGNRS